MTRDSRELPEQATLCLACACANPSNHAAADLLAAADAQTDTGVIAAIFLSTGATRWDLTERARLAIAAQREWCGLHGAFDAAHCTVERVRRGPSPDACEASA